MSYLPNQRTDPPPVPTRDWEIKSNDDIVKKGQGGNDQYRDNSSIRSVVRSVQQNKKGYAYQEFDVRGSNPKKDRKRQASSYVVTTSRYGVACNCPHAKQGFTCKHCIYVLLNEIRVPLEDVLSTLKCQHHLRLYAANNNWEEDR